MKSVSGMEEPLDEDRPISNLSKIGALFEGNNEIIEALKFLYKRVYDDAKFMGILRKIFLGFLTFTAVIFIFIFILYLVPILQELTAGGQIRITNSSELNQEATYQKQLGLIALEVEVMARKYNAYTTGHTYLVINTTDNRFLLYRNKKLVRDGFCSTGSYKQLITTEGKSWTFKTPKGKFRIHGKTTNPTWKKPDWAFVEEGLAIPTPNHSSRFEYGVLGDYAMALGDGYLIHGTIYKRFLGMPVTHGCVRLNDEDLKIVYNTMSVGSKVYIF